MSYWLLVVLEEVSSTGTRSIDIHIAVSIGARMYIRRVALGFREFICLDDSCCSLLCKGGVYCISRMRAASRNYEEGGNVAYEARDAKSYQPAPERKL